MRDDIEIPKAQDVYIAAIKEWDKDFTYQQWNVYLINDREDLISTVLVMSRGNSEDRRTSTLRHNLGDVPPKSSVKIEFIATEVLNFTNEYLITFFAAGKLFERNYAFNPQSISEENLINLPVMDLEGVIAK